MITQAHINAFFRVSDASVASPPSSSPDPMTDDWVVIDERFGVRKDSYAINRKGEVKNLKFGNILKAYYCKSNEYMCVSLKRRRDENGNLVRPNNGYGRPPVKDKPNNETLMLVHRLVGKVFIPNNNPNHKIIDHIDGNKLNNDYRNLRWCDQRRNANNAKSNNKYWGVRWSKQVGRWAAAIQTTINHDPSVYYSHFLGHYDEECDAARAVKKFMLEKYPNEMTGGRRFID